MAYYERELYKKFPLYARFLDEKGMLQHFAEALQPELQTLYQTMGERNYLFDPDLVPERFLSFVAQGVGLASRGERSLGIGIDPNWDLDRKRQLFKEAWTYWQTKGTESAIRKGSFYWLGWTGASSPDTLSVLQPFGKSPTDSPPLWWDYKTPYDDYLDLKWGERKQLGSGDYPQVYEPDWDLLTAADYSWEWSDPWWQDKELLAVDAVAPIDSPRSMIGPRIVWLQYSPDPGDWSKVFPDVLELNPEMLSTVARPAPFGWIEGGTVKPLWIEDFLPPDNTVEVIQDLEIDGLKWGELFPASVGSYRPTDFVVEEVEIEFGIWTGHQWNEFWEYDWYYKKNQLVRIRSVKTELEGAIAPVRVGMLGWSAGFDAIAAPAEIEIASPVIQDTDFVQLLGAELPLQVESFGFSADFLDEKSSTLIANHLRLKATSGLRSTAFTEIESNEQEVESPDTLGFSADLTVPIEGVGIESGIDSFDWSAERTLELAGAPIVSSIEELDWTASIAISLQSAPINAIATPLSAMAFAIADSAPLTASVGTFTSEANTASTISGAGCAIAASPVDSRAYNWFIQNVVA